MAYRLPLPGLASLILGVGLLGAWIGNGQAHEDHNLPFPDSKTFRDECGSCHVAYAPGFLPGRSWQRMMAGLDDHFGEDASLAEPERASLERILLDYAADGGRANALMRRIATGIPAGAAPQRISETPFFKHMHDEVPGYIWQRKKIGTPANCGACHTRAGEGRYDEREVRIPKQ